MDNTQTLIQTLKGKNAISNEKMEEVKEILEQASTAYYNTSDIIMSDDEFDALAREFKRLGGKLEVGAYPTKGKGEVNIPHTFNELVGTLEKANFVFEYEKDDKDKLSIEEWIRKIFKLLKKLGKDKVSIGISFKFDGNSVVIEYKDGKVIRALTRGRNGLGQDLTHVFKDHTIKSKEHVGIKYEVIISWLKFKELLEETGMTYANPRSLVAGKLNDDNAYDYYKYMELVPLWVKPYDGVMERMEQIEFIEESFGEENSLFSDYRIIEDVQLDEMEAFFDELKDMYQKYTSEERYDLPFMIDGLVLEVLEEDSKNLLGYTNDEPRWAVALKFPYMEKTTKVTGFDYTLGDSGIITSRVWFEPVTFNGTVHQKQSLQNYRRFKELNLGVGSEILVQYRNDCLTYVLSIDNEYNKTITPEEYIKECPVCGGKVEITMTGAFAKCSNDKCEGKVVGSVQNYLVKMDIKGIGESTIVKLKDAGLITNIIDLYTMDYGKIANVEGLGSITAINISGAINSKIPYDYEILGSLGINNISISKSKDLCKVFTLEELLTKATDSPNTLLEEIKELEGFSDITANYIVDGIVENDDTISFLLSRQHKVFRDDFGQISNAESLKIVFTNFRDEAFQTKLEMAGHKVTSGVSGKTDVVVTPNPNGNTVKLKKARDKGIRIVSVEDFKAEMNLA